MERPVGSWRWAPSRIERMPNEDHLTEGVIALLAGEVNVAPDRQ
jgi:hypothetical protein